MVKVMSLNDQIRSAEIRQETPNAETAKKYTNVMELALISSEIPNAKTATNKEAK